jgi:hypothetical protein
MLRSCLCFALALSLAAAPAYAADNEKKAETANGTIKKVDADKGMLIVLVKISKKETAEKEFKIGDTTKVIVFAGKEKKELAGKAGLQNDSVKEGVAIALVTSDGKVTEVRVGSPPKAETANGTIKKVDTAAGSITAAVKVKKKETADKEFKVADSTKVILFEGKEKKELTGKEGLKNELVKEGAQVAIVTDPDGKVIEVRVGKPAK